MRTSITFTLLLFVGLTISSCVSSNFSLGDTPTISPSILPSLDITGTIPPTLIPTKSSTPTRLPSLTPLPTFPPEQSEEVILQLMSTNAGCELPCWWGFKSGVSTSDQMQQQLARFIDSFRYGWPAIASKHDGGVGFTYPDNDQVGIIYLVPQNEIVIGMRIEGTYAITENYAIQDVLRKYPTPDEIWMYTWSEPMGEDVLQFIIVLDYSTKGFVIYYFSELGKLLTDTNDIQLCYSRETPPPKIILWNLVGKNPFLVNKSDYIYTIWPQMKPLEQATGLSMEEFIRWFTTGKELKEYCIKTPASLWEVP